MTVHGFIEYLEYKWKAKSRHGIHSPFVYAFIEDVIQDRKKIPVNNPIEFPELPLHYGLLVNRIIQYYQYESVCRLPVADKNNAGDSDVLILPAKEPLLWVFLANKYFHLLKSDTVVIVPDIHRTALQTAEWNRLCAHPKVLMSIDLYGIGLLFFRDEFKEKQHFVLKY